MKFLSIIHLLSKQKIYLSNLDEDIDGSTLALLEENDIRQMFPRIKDRVKFIDRRKKLISTLNESTDNIDETTNHLFSSTLSSSPSPINFEESSHDNTALDQSVLNKTNETNIEINLTTDSNLSSSVEGDDQNENIDAGARLPAEYECPTLTSRMQQYVDERNFSKFNPHTNMRSELLSLLFDDVVQSYQLL